VDKAARFFCVSSLTRAPEFSGWMEMEMVCRGG